MADPEGPGRPEPPGWSVPQPPSWTSPGGPGAPGAPAGGPPIPPGPPPGPPGPSFGPQYGAWGPPVQAPRPGIVPLRPLGVADILDGAIGYVRRDPRTVLGISAVLSLVLVVLSFLANFASFRSLSNLAQGDLYSADPADEALGGSAGIGGDVTALVAALLSLPISVIATGLLTVVVGQAVLGRRVSAGAAWRAARPQFWRLVGLTLLIGLIVGGTAVLGIGLAVLLAVLVAQVSTGLAVLLGILLGVLALCAAIWLAVRLLLSPVALILEKSGVGTAIRRSARLVSGSWWRVFGIALLAQLIAGLIAQVLTVPFAIGGVVLAIGFPSNGSLWWVTLAAVSVGTFVGSVVTMPFSAGVTALQYIDQRIRREALDLELARAANVR